MPRTLLALALLPLLSGCEVLILGSCLLRQDPVLLPESLPAGQVGQPYAEGVELLGATAPPYAIGVADEGTLPPGLSLSYEPRDRHAFITGTPQQPGRYELLIQARTYGTQCTGQQAQRRYRIDIEP